MANPDGVATETVASLLEANAFQLTDFSEHAEAARLLESSRGVIEAVNSGLDTTSETIVTQLCPYGGSGDVLQSATEGDIYETRNSVTGLTVGIPFSGNRIVESDGGLLVVDDETELAVSLAGLHTRVIELATDNVFSKRDLRQSERLKALILSKAVGTTISIDNGWM